MGFIEIGVILFLGVLAVLARVNFVKMNQELENINKDTGNS
jgi:hypothetical protein